MHKVVLPRYDPGMQSGRIVEWLKREGDEVTRGEPLLVVEGEKTTFEIEAPASGKLMRIIYPQGAEVAVTEAVAEISEVAEEDKAAGARPSQESKAPVEIGAGVIPEVETEMKASPLAKKIAREYGVQLSSIKGTGPGGRITREDVMAEVDRMSLGKTEPAEEGEEAVSPKVSKVVPVSSIRKTIAERLSYSFHTSVPVSLTVEVDFEDITRLRKGIQEKLKGEISMTALMVKSVSKALEEHKMLNSSLDGEVIKVFEDINVAVAIDTPQGLVAPVIHNANLKSIQEISKIISDYSQKAQDGKLQVHELTASTFTVTNLGGFSVDAFAPIINPPNSAIIGMGRVLKKPVIVGGRVESRARGNITVVFDHRVVDGAPAARFLEKVKELLENPYLLLT